MEKSHRYRDFIQRGLLTLFLAIIGWEWIKTLPVLTDTDTQNLFLFLGVYSFILFVYLLQTWWWVRSLTIFFFILFWYHLHFVSGSFFSLEWILRLWTQIKHDAGSILKLQWVEVDPYLRTLFFYLLLWLLTSLLQYRVIQQKKVLWWLLISIFYFTFLDTFFIFDGKFPVIKSIVSGFIMLSLTHLKGIEDRVGRRITGSQTFTWVSITLSLLLMFTSVGYLSPKVGPTWPDPVGFIKSMNAGAPGFGDLPGRIIQKTGYSNDDSYLGGPFIQSNELVLFGRFNGEKSGDVKYPSHYWRGESKDIYNGHGWESTRFEEVKFGFNEGIPFRLLELSEEVDSVAVSGKQIIESVRVYHNYPMLFTTGQPLEFSIGRPIDVPMPPIPDIKVDPERFRFGIVGNHLAEFSVTSLIPTVSRDGMREIGKRIGTGELKYPDEILERYLQLPETLPSRVKELGDWIVGNEENTYVNVVAIENYLKRGPYQYEMEDVPVPRKDEDFVDQFLFETKRGYCDHFSSSMVVLLRTQGIPARWVKGYAFGEEGKIDSTESQLTIVRELDAHSWVEVYFPEVGWLPFEPTKSFSLPYELEWNRTEQINIDEDLLDNERLQRLLEDEEIFPDPNTIKDLSTSQTGKLNVTTLWMVVGVMVLLGGVLVYLLRQRLRMWIQSLQVVRETGVKLVIHAYRVLLYWLERFFFPRPEGNTLREYTEALKLKDQEEDLIQLTKVFEEARYGERLPEIPRGQFINMWKNVLNKFRP